MTIILSFLFIIFAKNIFMSSFYKLQIKEVIQETDNAVSIAFHVPAELQSLYQFLAGQYVNLKLTLDGQEIRRAYSLCSSPESGELRIAIKSVQNGHFSKFANANLRAGDFLDVSKPEGKFTFEANDENTNNYIGFAAGSGITPVLSILKSILESEPKSTFTLVYGNKTAAETIFYAELQELQDKNKDRFFIEFVFSQTKEEGQLFGRIDKSVVNFVIHNKHKEKTFDKFYLCGPEEMINLVSSVLKEENVLETNIKFELFSSSSTKESIQIESNSGTSKIEMLVDDTLTTFQMSQKQTILEAALKQGIDAPYSCQGGICCSCLARIKKGTAEMKKNSVLTDNEIAEGLILTCQAYPTSDVVYVDYDDV